MRVLLLALAVAVVPSLVQAAEHPVHEGKWEVTSSTSFPGMGQMPAQTHTQCITHKDMVPKHDSPRAKNCKVTEQKLDGSTVNWKVQCEGSHGPIEGSGALTYSHDRFTGALKFTMNDPRGGGPMEITTTMDGKRVGECDDAK